MLVFSDETGAAGALAGDLHGRLERLGVYEPEDVPGCRTSPSYGSASGRASRRRRPALRTYVRPVLLFTYPYCGPQAPSTLSSRNDL